MEPSGAVKVVDVEVVVRKWYRGSGSCGRYRGSGSRGSGTADVVSQGSDIPRKWYTAEVVLYNFPGKNI